MADKPLVVDSYALLQFFQKEKGYAKNVRVLDEATSHGFRTCKPAILLKSFSSYV